MRIFTVTKGNRPLAVVRATDEADAIDTAVAMTAAGPADALAAREPNDAEMVGWIERRADYALVEQASAE
jgi:hypothetical protein